MSCNSETLSYRTEETYISIIDSFGPFPDETILSILDKLLYLLGVQNMETATKSIIRRRRCGEEEAYETCDTFQSGRKSSACVSPMRRIRSNSQCRLSNTSMHKTPSITKSAARCTSPCAPLQQAGVSSSPTPADEKKPPVSTPPADDASLSSSLRFLEHPLVQELICPICGGTSGGKPDTSKIQSLIEDYEEFQRNPVKATLRHSLSFCSQAARKLKKVLSDTFQIPKMQTADLDWFWTRRREEGGHHILEIYENTDLRKHSSQKSLKEYLSLILIVTPSGIVMPFEPVEYPN